MVCLHRTDRRKLVTIFIIQLYRQEYLFRVLDRVDVCTEGIVLQQSNLVDSTVTLHLQLVVRTDPHDNNFKCRRHANCLFRACIRGTRLIWLRISQFGVASFNFPRFFICKI